MYSRDIAVFLCSGRFISYSGLQFLQSRLFQKIWKGLNQKKAQLNENGQMIKRFKLVAIIATISLVLFYFLFIGLGSVTDRLADLVDSDADKTIDSNDILFQPIIHNTKFIQYECNAPNRVCGGWADRLKGIMATYALSVVLNRSFLIQITQPCYIESLLQPGKVDWTRKIDRDKMKIYRIDDNGLLRGLFEHIDLETYSADMMNSDLISIQSNVMYTNCAVKNPRFKPILAKLGYDDPNQFKVHNQMYKWYKRLFRLSPALEERHQEIYKKLKPNPRTFVFCTQIRTGITTNLNKEDLKFGEKDLSKKYWKFINDTFISNITQYTKEKDNWRIYVTTDQEWIKKEGAQIFGEDKVVYNPQATAHMDLDFSNLKDKCGPIENVILDFHTLQHCDAALISHSGFGLLGIWNRPVPNQHVYLYTKPNQNDLKQHYWGRDNLAFVKVTNFDDIYFL